MPDWKDYEKAHKQVNIPKNREFSEAELQRFIEKGLKSQDLMHDPLWGVLVKELGASIASADRRIESLKESIISRDMTIEGRAILLRELDYAQGTKEAYESVVDACENLAKEGEKAKNELILFDQNN